LIRAAAKFPKEVGFYLIGGDAPEKLVNIKDRLGATNVHFIPFSSKEKLKQYYTAADLFCFPTREDIWGLVINEAMGYGLPVITTDRCNAGIEMVKDDVNGYIIPVESVNDIVQKSAMILSDEDIQVRMGRESIKTAHRFTVESMSLSHMELFEKEK
jgi:glycosyltransferase involved in cell wall biosynthesis